MPASWQHQVRAIEGLQLLEAFPHELVRGSSLVVQIRHGNQVRRHSRRGYHSLCTHPEVVIGCEQEASGGQYMQ